jgi:hypothetical protein
MSCSLLFLFEGTSAYIGGKFPFACYLISHAKNYMNSGSKVIVGTQMGILSVFNRSQGWGDCVDRVPG